MPRGNNLGTMATSGARVSPGPSPIPGLRYVSDAAPGIGRRRAGKGFTYTDENGRRVKDPETLARIRSLAIPPAWTDVWICPTSNGHLQATGRDARGRKQYRYNDRWRTLRDESKFEQMAEFGRALTPIRKRIHRDLRLDGLPREKVLATVVRIMDTAYARIGNLSYARENNSFGLTTLRDRHVEISGTRVRFEFTGKGGKAHAFDVDDPRLAKIVRRCRDLPGYDLFQYVEDDGTRRTVGSGDVNDYLREISGGEFTAKCFRTWAGSVVAAKSLADMRPVKTDRAAKRNVVRAIEAVAENLGNTPSIARKSYVHPLVIEAYLEGSLAETWDRALPKKPPQFAAKLRGDEQRLLRLLKPRAQPARKAG
jgi:DNA topoisomerase I